MAEPITTSAPSTAGVVVSQTIDENEEIEKKNGMDGTAKGEVVTEAGASPASRGMNGRGVDPGRGGGSSQIGDVPTPQEPDGDEPAPAIFSNMAVVFQRLAPLISELTRLLIMMKDIQDDAWVVQMEVRGAQSQNAVASMLHEAELERNKGWADFARTLAVAITTGVVAGLSIKKMNDTSAPLIKSMRDGQAEIKTIKNQLNTRPDGELEAPTVPKDTVSINKKLGGTEVEAVEAQKISADLSSTKKSTQADRLQDGPEDLSADERLAEDILKKAKAKNEQQQKLLDRLDEVKKNQDIDAQELQAVTAKIGTYSAVSQTVTGLENAAGGIVTSQIEANKKIEQAKAELARAEKQEAETLANAVSQFSNELAQAANQLARDLQQINRSQMHTA